MLKIIALLALAGIAGVAVAAAFRPNTSRISRSMRIAAAPETIYPLINELAAFNRWNLFDKKDGNTHGSYQGPASGPGALYAFKGRQTGEGTIEITDVRPAREVRMRLKMVKPMKCDNAVTFAITQQGDESEVRWTMQGKTPYLAKLLHMFCNMDKMCGREFEKGLASLKSLAEARA